MFVLKDKKGNPVANFPYKITLADGNVLRSLTDVQGRAIRVGSGTQAAGIRIDPDMGQ